MKDEYDFSKAATPDRIEQFRLHIDIPLGLHEDGATEDTKAIMECILQNLQLLRSQKEMNFPQVSYRLGHDSDRQKSNYLEKTESGHVVNKKSRHFFPNSGEGA